MADPHSRTEKILSLEALLRLRAAARVAGRRVVHCHGCFDIVHPGHIRHLRFARAQGDLLLVSITGDEQVGKGDGRPLIPQELRAENLAELDCVDWVYVEPEPTAEDLLESVRPDVYIKGREYEFNKDPRFQREREAVERHGGRVVFSSGDVVFSSTALIESLETSVDPFGARLGLLLGREGLSSERLGELIESFRGRRVVIVGETIIDTYVFCDRPDVAGESPVMTLRPLEHRRYDGGAAIIARHAAALGARPVLVTALPGEAAIADEIRRRLLAEGVEVRAITAPSAIAEKQRFLVGAQKVMKLDLVEASVLDAAGHDRLIALAAEAAEESPTDAGIVADFGLGLLTPAVIGRLCARMRPLVGTLTGDVSGRRAGLRAMHGLDLVCPSEPELREAYRSYDESLPAVAWELFEQTGAGAAIVTMGPEGLIAFDPLADAEQRSREWRARLRSEHVPALVPHAVDALGCGDALLTAATLGLASGADLVQAAVLGSSAAAIESRRIGNVPVASADLRREIRRLHASHMAYAAAEVLPARRYEQAGALRDAS